VIKLEEKQTPAPSRGEVVIQVKASLTCGTDLKAFRRGHHVIPMPGAFGHEFSGIVAAAGKGVKGFKEGDPIMSVHSAPCLTCMYCKKGAHNLCVDIMNTKVLGAFAEYLLLPRHIVRQNVFHKPKSVSFEEAAFLEPLSCVLHGMSSLNVKKDDYALVIGAGPIGLLHLLLLKEKGAIVAQLDIHGKRLKIAKECGADVTITPKDINKIFPYSSITPFAKSRLRGGKKVFRDFIGFDYVFECTGMPEVWESSITFVRRGGTVVLFGGCKSGTTVTYDTGRIHYDEITLRGVFHYTPADVKKAFKLLCSRKPGVSRLISGHYPLTKIQRAFDKLAKGEGIKYAIIP
jgi:L-iditol 2-dehydrogenase